MKQRLKGSVKQTAQQTSDVIASRMHVAAAPGPHPATPITEDGVVLGWMEDLEACKVADEPKSFLFALDGVGGLWAHGAAPCAAKGKVERVPGLHGVGTTSRGSDATVRFTDPYMGGEEEPDGGKRTTVHDVLTMARRGGGFAHFRLDGGLMLAYVCPVRGTDLVLGGALPVPHAQKVWEESNWSRACKKRQSEEGRGK